MKILALGAHPDDVEIYCFGTLLAYQALGHEIAWAIATDGSPKGAGPEMAATRKAEATAGGALAGVKPIFLGFQDGALGQDPTLVPTLEALYTGEKPDLVITHPPEDYHPDHRALSVAALDAARFRVPVLYADSLNGTGFLPQFWVDISGYMATKQAAIRCHVSQRPERFVESATTLNRLRSLQCNAGAEGAYAECFRFDPRAPFADVRGMLPPAPEVKPLVRW
jgi:LmbE family N-acetylglucosaminyl deacetylase